VLKLQTPLLCCFFLYFDCLSLSVLLAAFVVFSRIFSQILLLLQKFGYSKYQAKMVQPGDLEKSG